MTRDARAYVAGHRGLVGSAIIRRLSEHSTTAPLTATRDQLDLRDQAAVNYWFRANRPEYVYLMAGTVGGILANSTRQCVHARVYRSTYERQSNAYPLYLPPSTGGEPLPSCLAPSPWTGRAGVGFLIRAPPISDDQPLW